MQYNNVGYETADTNLTIVHKDSIKQVGPFSNITVTTTDGRSGSADLYRMPKSVSTIMPFEENEEHLKYDLDKLYVVMQGDSNWYVGQYFTFDRLLKTPSYFKPAPAVGK